ncbi:hypothetical protein JZO77_03550 [Enterococcus hulanensis]|uniref:hypothetical protein n=1 Tax=Enterococcus hulanensis TaxID=2559929 RepID=UPI001A8C6FBE|nr:hypothetical protein [Enterococcus hulanensis]MBO0455814.1 hypothetical protein [Enterococcus hulanensis]
MERADQFYFNRIEGEVGFVDPKQERISTVAIEMWRDFRAGRLVLDECHNIYNPEADRLADKLRNRGTKRQSSSDQI